MLLGGGVPPMFEGGDFTGSGGEGSGFARRGLGGALGPLATDTSPPCPTTLPTLGATGRSDGVGG